MNIHFDEHTERTKTPSILYHYLNLQSILMYE